MTDETPGGFVLDRHGGNTGQPLDLYQVVKLLEAYQIVRCKKCAGTTPPIYHLIGTWDEMDEALKR